MLATNVVLEHLYQRTSPLLIASDSCLSGHLLTCLLLRTNLFSPYCKQFDLGLIPAETWWKSSILSAPHSKLEWHTTGDQHQKSTEFRIAKGTVSWLLTGGHKLNPFLSGESQNHRISWVERDPQESSSLTPGSTQNHPKSNPTSERVVQMLLNSSRLGAMTTALRSHAQPPAQWRNFS